RVPEHGQRGGPADGLHDHPVADRPRCPAQPDGHLAALPAAAALPRRPVLTGASVMSQPVPPTPEVLVNGPPPSPQALPAFQSGSRLAAIARGESVPSVVHQSVAGEDHVLVIEKFNLWYGTKQALFTIGMGVPRGQVTALIGPSGCGKSTLIRCVNRMNDLLDNVTIKGDMRLQGDSIYGKGVDVIELRKRMGMVFQKPNPFPMSIYENVVYPLRVDGVRDQRTLDEACE